MISGLFLGVLLSLGIWLYTDRYGSALDRYITLKPPVEIVAVEPIGASPNITGVRVTIRSNALYSLTGEVGYGAYKPGWPRPFYEHPDIAFGPVGPNDDITVDFEAPEWDTSEAFRLKAWASEYVPDYEPRATVPETAENITSVVQNDYIIEVGDLDANKRTDSDNSLALSLNMTITNRTDHAHKYRVLLDLRPADNVNQIASRSDFMILELDSGATGILTFEEDSLVDSETDYTIWLWVQVADDDKFFHMTQITVPQTVRLNS